MKIYKYNQDRGLKCLWCRHIPVTEPLSWPCEIILAQGGFIAGPVFGLVVGPMDQWSSFERGALPVDLNSKHQLHNNRFKCDDTCEYQGDVALLIFSDRKIWDDFQRRFNRINGGCFFLNNRKTQRRELHAENRLRIMYMGTTLLERLYFLYFDEKALRMFISLIQA